MNLEFLINRKRIIFFAFCAIVAGSSEEDELETCLGSFDVHRDKIIRTQDSTEMGAKYLIERDFYTRNECSRFCCETKGCNVFVYEEKKPGSCYLFNCGSLNDFKCKFTSHANYSSAVLTTFNSPNIIQLENEVYSRQEHELKSLRKKIENFEEAWERPKPIPLTQAPKVMTTSTALPKLPKICNRNQFPCSSNGECIAIYNVCDGISQCADGSDEAEEMGCPTTEKSQQERLMNLDKMTNQNLKFSNDRRKPYPMQPEERDKFQGQPWEWNPEAARLGIPPPQQLYPPRQQHLPNQPPNNYNPGYPTNWDYQQYYEQSRDNYNNMLKSQENNPNYDQEQQPHIFNHRRPVGNNANRNGEPNVDPNGRPFMPYYPNVNHGNWHEGQPNFIPPTTMPPPVQNERANESPQETTTKLPSTTTPCPEPHKMSSDKSEALNKTVHESHAVEKSKEHQENSFTSEIKHSPHTVRPPEVPRKPVEEHVMKMETMSHHIYNEHLRHFHSNNYENLRPRGAVISLALGLTATAAMAALIACRLRVVRRRARRGQGLFAHDADYLVNGMYL